MLLRGGAFSACNAAVGEHQGQGNYRFSGLIRRPMGSVATVWCSRARRGNLLRVASVATGEPKSKPQESSYQPSVADRLRLGSLTEDGLSYKEKFIVRCYEVGINKTATVETIANLLQEVGCNHAQSVGFSTDGFATTTTMRKMHLIWVTARMHIEIYKYPAWSDVVEIETWCQSEGRIGTRRDWILKDYATGEVIGRATRLAFPEENNASLKKISKLDDPAEYSKVGLVPRRADLDMNQHVNNVTYIGWVLESMPQEIIDSYELQTITLDYRRECQHDDVVDSLTTPEPIIDDSVSQLHGTNGSPTAAKDESDYLQFLHLLRISNDGSEINRGRTEWRKKPAK
ncbi:Oleoyl-acyl carrier protein thioesterase, chloroplastic [Sesamum angolense]|uniref:Acyl-[acyl-carrier-protein] hydrolase n=1 Tax=Sesamum angolense TaxID=2727404 RepID=A0AAE2C4F3_9LAMI|nr:Oleoyl-acyl carrier protein thioesterase, chloroplastic [Sesamum angolense]